MQAFIGLAHWRLVGKGRLLTRPLWRFRLFRPYVSPYSGELRSANVRTAQIIALGLIESPVAMLAHPWWLGRLSVALVVAFYLDDYFTGDDERWKRFKDRARNAIRWRMKLPVPATDRSS